jgi:hypothetical protein
MTYVYLDIETIPAQSEDAKARVAASVKPPAAMKKADTIAAWEKDGKAGAVEDAIAKTSFSGAFGHICCIGWAIGSSPAASQEIHDPMDEVDILVAFFDRASRDIGNGFPVIVGHNVVGFDIRFIWQRAMVLGVRVPNWFPRDPKPWDASVFDTMTAWAGARDTISMDNLAAALGLPGKGDVDGSMVAQMFADGKFAEIADYCRQDVERTRSIHRKMMVSFGEAA